MRRAQDLSLDVFTMPEPWENLSLNHVEKPFGYRHELSIKSIVETLHPTQPLFQRTPQRSLCNLALNWFPDNWCIKANSILFWLKGKPKIIKQRCCGLCQSQFDRRKPLSSVAFFDRTGFLWHFPFFMEEMLFWRDWMILRPDTEKLFIRKSQ